jgi:hypothetical protein
MDMKARRKLTKAEHAARVAKMVETKRRNREAREQGLPTFVREEEARPVNRGPRKSLDAARIALATELVRLVQAILR